MSLKNSVEPDLLESKLLEIITSIQSATEKAGGFAVEQMPELAQSYIFYGRMSSIFYTGAMLMVAFAFAWLSRWAYKNPWNDSTYSFDRNAKRSGTNPFVIGLGAVCSMIFFLLALATANMLVWFAPKVWLLREIANVIR